MTSSKQPEFQLEDYRIVPEHLNMHYHNKEIAVGKRLMRLLVYLAKRQGEIVKKEELLQEVWGGVLVSDDAIRKSISDLRLLFTNGQQQLELETIRGVGYRLHSKVRWRKRFLNTFRWRRLIFPVGIALAGLGIFFFHSNAHSGFDAEKPNPLFQNLAVVRLPRVSKDASKIVYASYQNGESRLYLYRLQEHRHELIGRTGLMRAEAAIAPDGDCIAFLGKQNGTNFLFVKNLKANETRQLTRLEQIPIQSALDWSPNGKQIAFTEARDGSAFRLYVIEPESRKIKSIVIPPDATMADLHPRFAPSGSRLAFIRCSQSSPLYGQYIQGLGNIYIKDLKTGTERALTNQGAELGGFAWLDEETIAYVTNDGFNFFVLAQSLNGGPTDTLYQSTRFLRHIEFCKNKLLVEVWKEPYGMKLLHLSKNEVQRQAYLFKKESRFWHPAFSPDGNLLCYAGPGSNAHELLLFDIKSRTESVLATAEKPFKNPVWAPDGKSILYQQHGPSENRIFIHILETGVSTWIANGKNPSWAASGDAIYYTNDRSQVFRHPRAPDGKPVKIEGLLANRVIPYANSLLFTRKRHAGIWAFDLRSGDTSRVVTDLFHLDQDNWTVQGQELIYWKRNDNQIPVITAYDLAQKRSRHIYALNQFLNYQYSGFSLNRHSGTLAFPGMLYLENEILEVPVSLDKTVVNF